MDLKTFTEHFALLADTPNGISKLREMVLQLAVMGKLVPQNPDDEPATVLLRKIAAEKGRLIAKGKIKKYKPLPPIESSEVPYELPEGWKWVLMQDISKNVHYGYTASADPTRHDIKLLRITDIQNDKVDWSTVPGCQIDKNLFKQYALSDGDIVVARTGGTIGKSYLVSDLEVEAVFASYLIRIMLSSHVNPLYVKMFLGSELYWNQLYEKSMGTGQPNVNGVSLKGLQVPLSPFEEQNRIVSKVDELMALCDELEERQEKRDTVRTSMNSACLHELTSPEPEKSQKGWARTRDHFDLLYDIPDNVAALRQSILQLAVMGKLVPQDPNDEPASVLLEKIATEKERLIAEGKIRKSKSLPPINTIKEPYELPHGWKWVRLGNVAEVLMGNSPPGASYNETGEGVPLINGPVEFTNGSFGRTSSTKFTTQPTKMCMAGDLLVCVRGATTGRTNIAAEDSCIGRGVAAVRPYIHDRFVHWFMVHTEKQLLGIGAGSTFPSVSFGKIVQTLFPLPPLAEQKRIVAKVDELVGLCDQLQSKLLQSRIAGENLMAAVVNQITVL